MKSFEGRPDAETPAEGEGVDVEKKDTSAEDYMTARKRYSVARDRWHDAKSLGQVRYESGWRYPGLADQVESLVRTAWAEVKMSAAAIKAGLSAESIRRKGGPDEVYRLNEEFDRLQAEVQSAKDNLEKSKLNEASDEERDRLVERFDNAVDAFLAFKRDKLDMKSPADEFATSELERESGEAA